MQEREELRKTKRGGSFVVKKAEHKGGLEEITGNVISGEDYFADSPDESPAEEFASSSGSSLEEHESVSATSRHSKDVLDSKAGKNSAGLGGRLLAESFGMNDGNEEYGTFLAAALE